MSAKLIKQEFVEVRYPVLRKNISHGALVLFASPNHGICISNENQIMPLGFHNLANSEDREVWERVDGTLEISG